MWSCETCSSWVLPAIFLLSLPYIFLSISPSPFLLWLTFRSWNPLCFSFVLVASWAACSPMRSFNEYRESIQKYDKKKKKHPSIHGRLGSGFEINFLGRKAADKISASCFLWKGIRSNAPQAFNKPTIEAACLFIYFCHENCGLIWFSVASNLNNTNKVAL